MRAARAAFGVACASTAFATSRRMSRGIASTSPPPSTTMSGLRKSTRLEIAAPTTRARLRTSFSTALSPCRIASARSPLRMSVTSVPAFSRSFGAQRFAASAAASPAIAGRLATLSRISGRGACSGWPEACST